MQDLRAWAVVVALLTGCGGQAFVFDPGDARPDALAADVDAGPSDARTADVLELDAGDASSADGRPDVGTMTADDARAADVVELDAPGDASRAADVVDDLVDANPADVVDDLADVVDANPNEAGIIDAGPPPVVCEAYRAPCSGTEAVECIYGSSYECCSGPCPL